MILTHSVFSVLSSVHTVGSDKVRAKMQNMLLQHLTLHLHHSKFNPHSFTDLNQVMWLEFQIFKLTISK